jgi:hypothetical protein
MKREKFKGILIPDVRPVDQREKKMDLRKGMRKGKTKGNDVWKVLQLPLFGNPYDRDPVNVSQGDEMEPDYIKKHKNIMK